ncbi:class C beta-lactamase [Teichococcus vastitatis]|uniref:Beta-lactamase n=1 Tax=Teichococcus vastitatis TaxID=2307076 RepID=A0ABS9W1K7_9PROT|nr:class C beta-lactamase [Pseudoroseomonas vastitatis]MCI0753092.1 beta-lactamase [Pseudoroseomonas vastitatis]
MTPATLTRRTMALTLLPFCLLPDTVRAAGTPDAVASALDRIYRPLAAAHDVPGMAVAVTAGGRHWFRNYGVASREDGIPVTEHTLFEIGSISKIFTGTLAAYAEAVGALSLEDRPGRYLPSLRDSAIDRASLLHLGTYTAGGLPLQFPAGVTGDAGMIEYFRQWTPASEPGKQRRYSNPSIGLLGHVTASAMGDGYRALAERELFPRLGLPHTHIRIPEAEMDRYAWGYGRDNAPIRVNPGVLDAEAYGVKSSAADLIRLLDGNLRPSSLHNPVRRAVERTQSGYFSTGDMAQGLGWERYVAPVTLERMLAGNSSTMALEAQAVTPLPPAAVAGQPFLFNKTGSTNGFGGYLAFRPDKGVGLVMLANRNIPNAARVTAAHAVLEQFSAHAP